MGLSHALEGVWKHARHTQNIQINKVIGANKKRLILWKMRNGLSGQPNTLAAQVARRCLSHRAAELLISLTLKQRGATAYY